MYRKLHRFRYIIICFSMIFVLTFSNIYSSYSRAFAPAIPIVIDLLAKCVIGLAATGIIVESGCKLAGYESPLGFSPDTSELEGLSTFDKSFFNNISDNVKQDINDGIYALRDGSVAISNAAREAIKSVADTLFDKEVDSSGNTVDFDRLSSANYQLKISNYSFAKHYISNGYDPFYFLDLKETYGLSDDIISKESFIFLVRFNRVIDGNVISSGPISFSTSNHQFFCIRLIQGSSYYSSLFLWRTSDKVNFEIYGKNSSTPHSIYGRYVNGVDVYGNSGISDAFNREAMISGDVYITLTPTDSTRLDLNTYMGVYDNCDVSYTATAIPYDDVYEDDKAIVIPNVIDWSDYIDTTADGEDYVIDIPVDTVIDGIMDRVDDIVIDKNIVVEVPDVNVDVEVPDVNVDVDLSPITSFLQRLLDSILSIPQSILDGLIDLVVPDSNYLDDLVDEFNLRIFSPLGLDYDFSSRFGGEKPLNDIYFDFWGQRVKIVDFSWFIRFWGSIKGIIRGFIVFLLIIFNINQFLSLIGQPSIAEAIGNPSHEKKGGRHDN